MTISRAWGTYASLNRLGSFHDTVADTACRLCVLLFPALCSCQACSVLSRRASYIHTSMFLPALFGRPGNLAL